MRSPIILFTLLVSITSQSQQWLPFDTAATRAVFHLENSLIVIDTPAISLAADDLIQLSLKDSIASGTHYLSSDKVKGCSIFDPSSDCFEQQESCQDYFSWIGNPVITTSWSSYSAVNRWGDTITLPVVGTDSTLAWTRGDSSYYFVHTAVKDTIIDGFSDSIAVFEVALEINGVATNGGNWNNQELWLSKTKGFLSMPVWYLFPQEKVIAHRYQTAEDDPISYNSLFSYEVGDEIHFTRSHEKGRFGVGQGLIGIDEDFDWRYSCTVAAINTDAENNKVFTLACNTVTTEWTYATNGQQTSTSPTGHIITVDSTTETWDITNSSGGILSQTIKQSVFISFDGSAITASSAEVTSGSQSNQDCPLYEFIFEPWTQKTWDFRSDIGLIRSSSSVANDGSGTYMTSSFRLEYYQGANGTYGTPLIIAGTNEVSAADQLRMYPNPSTGIIQIQSAIKVSHLVVIDQSGREMLQMKNPASSIDLQSLESGIYFVNIELESGETISRKLVLTL